jgi:hypothetical protein
MLVHANYKPGKRERRSIVVSICYGRLGMTDRRGAMLFLQSATQKNGVVALRGIGVCQGVSRIERECAFEK